MSLLSLVLNDIHQYFSSTPESPPSPARSVVKRASEWNGVVSSDNARAHLRSLRKAGVSLDLISAASKISLESLTEIKSGDRKTIRAATERAILSVHSDIRRQKPVQNVAQKDACLATIASRSSDHHRSINDGTLVSSRLSLRLLDELRNEYFKDPRIARELDVSVADLRQIGSRVSADFECAIKALHARLMN